MRKCNLALGLKLEQVLDVNSVEIQKDGCIILEESDNDSRMTVELVNLPLPVTAVSLHGFSHAYALKNGPWKLKCDYLLTFTIDGTEHVVFIELKKSMNKYEKAKEQLRWSLPFLEYLRSICRIAYPLDVDLPRVKMRHFNIVERLSPSLDKQPVRVGPNRILKSERHENITVMTLIGTTIPFSTILRA